MAYRFKKKESVAKAVKRLGRERIEHALECLKDADRAEAVHGVRKDIKKTRAVLRLIRPRIAKKDFQRLTATLRKAAAHLAASRDACVKVQTLRRLMEHFQAQLASGALRHIRAELRSNSDEEITRLGNAKADRAVERTLRRAGKKLARLKLSAKGWEALGPGMKTAYRQGRQACQTVVTDPSPENFHVWRKRVKDLWYHVRLLQPMWPEQLDAMASELEKLDDNLGDDHDLAVLESDLEQRAPGHHPARELETLHGLIAQRQRELRAVALALGARFYAEKPSMFCQRLEGYWQTWRREKKNVTRSVAGPP